MHTPAIRIPAQQRQQLTKQAFCYGWWRDKQYLYIGYTTTQGYKRISDEAMTLEPDDEVHFWYPLYEPCADVQVNKARELQAVFEYEKLLKDYYKPVMNTVTTQDKIACGFCKTPFEANRPWQVFCSKKCREASWKASQVVQEDGVPRVCKNPNGCTKPYMLAPHEFNVEWSYLCPECRQKQYEIKAQL